MPRYEYECKDGHRSEVIRKISTRHDPLKCVECRKPMYLAISKPHCMPDGMYSYAPNIGSPDKFERRLEAIRAGKKVIPASAD